MIHATRSAIIYTELKNTAICKKKPFLCQGFKMNPALYRKVSDQGEKVNLSAILYNIFQ